MARLGLVACGFQLAIGSMNIQTNNHAPYVNILVHQIEQRRYKQNYLKNEYFPIFKKLPQVPLGSAN